MLNGVNVVIDNVRMCPECYQRYENMEKSLKDKNMMQMSDSDAKTIVYKLVTSKMEIKK
jgi:hypothetical protein